MQQKNVEDEIEFDPNVTSLKFHTNNQAKRTLSRFKIENKEFRKTFSQLSIRQNSTATNEITLHAQEKKNKPLLKFSKKVENKVIKRRLSMANPEFKLTKEEKARINKIKFQRRHAYIDPLLSMIDFGNNVEKGLSPASKKVQQGSVILKEKKRIYQQNNVDITITDPELDQYGKFN